MVVDDDYHQLCAAVEATLADPSAMSDHRARSAAWMAAQQAVQWCRDHLPANDPELAAALSRSARVHFPTTDEHAPVLEVDGDTDWSYAHDLREALQIRKVVYGTSSEPVLWTLSRISWCRLRRNEWEKAERTLVEQRDVLRALRGPDSLEEAAVHAQLGAVAAQQNLMDQADTHYERSVAIWGRHPLNPAAVHAFTGWGHLREARGDLNGALDAYRTAVTVLTAEHGQSSTVLADNLMHVARVHQRQGDLDQASVLYRRVLAIRQAHLTNASPLVAATWEALSIAVAGVHPSESLDACRGALASDGAWLMSGAVATQDDRDARLTQTNMIRHADHHLAMTLHGAASEELLIEAAGVAAWRRRLPDLFFGSAWLVTSAEEAGLERRQRSTAAELAGLKQQSPPAWEGDHRGIEAFMELVQHRGHLQTTAADLGEQLRARPITSEQAMPFSSTQVATLRRALGAEECVVEVVRLPEPVGQYRALVMGPGAQIRTVTLGSTSVVDACALRARAALAGPSRAATFRDLSARSRDADADAAAMLASVVIGPLRPLLDACRRVTFVVDGGPLLHVPLGALSLERDGEPWLADITVTYANGLDEVARDWMSPFGIASGRDVVVAAPDYDLAATDLDSATGTFTPLEGTLVEGERVAGLLACARLLAGPDALKAHIRALHSPRILHIATHGYAFISGADRGPDTLASTVGRADALPTRFEHLRGDPELRCGLALAGANTWLRHGDPGPDAESGLLTYADIAGLDILGTDLVVLSACDTGLGDILASSGHSSLRAGFIRAGVRTVVASLWKVPDKETATLMTHFYTYLAEGHGKADALRLAQLDMHHAGAPPATWGAFVCYGDPGPLHPTTSGRT
ncbi:CHAT domain-containing tetratricopeptide repeat protein [Dactylosporangium sp. NPDC050588]|uniref:CHAT domain-containing protein n=1 Tax=Dactylosporangium sp. NPDC050588 TaxID=3157211 RepID=UPI0033EA29BD